MTPRILLRALLATHSVIRSWLDDGNRLDFYEEIGVGKPPHLDRCARRQEAPKYFIRTSMCRKNSSISSGKRLRAHEIGQRGAGGRESGFEIFADLSNLRAHIARADDRPLLISRGNPDTKTSLPGTTVTTGA